MKTKHLLRIIVLFSVLLAPLTLWAMDNPFGDLSYLSEGDKQKVRDNFNFGKKRWDKGDYKTAAKHFGKVHKLTDIAVFIYHIGRCHEELGNYLRAIDYFETYLEEVPSAKTETDTQWRIDQINEKIMADEQDVNYLDSMEDDGPDVFFDEPDEEGENGNGGKKKLKSITIGIMAGGMAVPMTPNDATHVHIPIDFFTQFAFARWFMLTAGFGFSRYVEGDIPWPESNNAIEGQVGLTVGFAFAAPMAKKFSLYFKFQFAPTWLSRFGSSALPWLAGQGMIGAIIHVSSGWSIYMEGGSNVGRILNNDPAEGGEEVPWGATRYDYADVGGKLGVAYTFKFTD